MRKRLSKLRLNRETVRALDGGRLLRVAGAKTMAATECLGTCAFVSECFSCEPNCPDSVACPSHSDCC